MQGAVDSAGDGLAALAGPVSSSRELAEQVSAQAVPL